MKELYKKILEKPEAYRRRLTLVITGIAGVIVFSVWLGMTYNSMQRIVGSPEDEEVNIEDIQNGHAPSLEDRSTEGQINASDYSDSDIYQKEKEVNIYDNSSDNKSETEIKNESSETIYEPSY